MGNILKATIKNHANISFKFSSMEGFYKKMKEYGLDVDEHPESIVFQYVQGKDMELFNASGLNFYTLDKWFKAVELLDTLEKAKLFYLMAERGYSLEGAFWEIDNTIVYEDDLLRAATEFFDERFLHEIPVHLQLYVDYERFAHNLRLAGDLREFFFNNRKYTAVC